MDDDPYKDRYKVPGKTLAWLFLGLFTAWAIIVV